MLGDELGGRLADRHAGPVGEQGHVGALAQGHRPAEGDGVRLEIRRYALAQAVAVERLYDHGRLGGLHQRVVHPHGLEAVARRAHVHAAQGTEQHPHRRARVPDALEPVAARADDRRGALLAVGAVERRGEVVRQGRERVDEVVEVLDLGDGAQAPQREPDRLADDGPLADPRVEHALLAVLGLQPGESLVDVADLPDVLPERHHARVALEEAVEEAVEHAEAHLAPRVVVAVAVHRVLGGDVEGALALRRVEHRGVVAAPALL